MPQWHFVIEKRCHLQYYKLREKIMNLKEIRKAYAITQKEAAKSTGVPLRTYMRYEKLDDITNLKYQRIIELLKEKYEITEIKGVYRIEQIKEIILKVISDYKNEIIFCYLFGSYAKGYAKEDSDIDICINTTLSGFKFVGLVEKLHQELKKNVDVIRFNDLSNNLELISEIMKDGIKIYG